MPSSLSTLLFRDALRLLTDSTFDAAPIVTAEVFLDGIPASVDALADPQHHATILIDRRSDAATVD